MGGLAVLARLSSAHRATVDLDIVDRRGEGAEGQLEILLRSPQVHSAGPVGVLVPTRFGEVKVDVLEVNQSAVDHPSDNSGDRLHAQAHAWAAETATELAITVVTGRDAELVSVSARVAEPGPLVAMNLQAIMDRGDAKAGTDVWDITRLVLDPHCGPVARRQLASCDGVMARDVAEHVEGWFRTRRTWVLERLEKVAGTVVTADDLDLVRDLLLAVLPRR